MIPLAISLASVLTFLVVGIVSLRRALFWFVVALPFLPHYFAIPLGGGAGLAAARLSAYVLFMLIMVSMILDQKSWQPTFAALRQHRWVLWLFGVITLARLLSTLAFQPVGVLYYWADEAVLLFSVLLLSVRVCLDLGNIEKLGRVLFGVALVQALLALLEGGLDRHLLAGIVNIEVATVGTDILEGRIRGGGHRAQTLFDNPLSLAEYMLYALIAILFLYRPTRSRRSLVTWGVLGLIVLAILQTKSRFPFLLLAVSGLTFQTLSVTARMASKTRAIVSGALLLVGAAIVYLGGYFVFNFEQFLPVIDEVFFSGENVEGRNSVIERGLQYNLITGEILSNPFGGLLGEGYRSGLIWRLELKLDNYYLRMLIEGGVFAVLALISMIAGLALTALRGFRQTRTLPLTGEDRGFLRRFYLGMLFFFISFGLSKLFLSMNFNNYMLFLFAGAIIAVNCRVRESFGASAQTVPHPQDNSENLSVANTWRAGPGRAKRPSHSRKTLV